MKLKATDQDAVLDELGVRMCLKKKEAGRERIAELSQQTKVCSLFVNLVLGLFVFALLMLSCT